MEAMETIFNNLQDNIVYHSNIFNYDKQFLMTLINRGVKLNFSEYISAKNKQSTEIAQVLNYLSLKAKEQVDLMTYAYYSEYELLPQDLDEEILKKKVQDSKDAVKTLRLLFNLLMFSLEKAEDKANLIDEASIQAGDINCDNIITCLLFFDGISMVNIDIIKLIGLNALNTGKSLPDLIFRILNNKKMDFHIQEIASHILSLFLMCNEGGDNEAEKNFEENCRNLMKWTYELCIQKQRESCFSSNLSLLLTIDENVDYFLEDFNKEFPCIRKLFDLMTDSDNNINIIYECLFCIWNISNNKKNFSFFEQKENRYIEKIVQVIRTNKIDKVARIGLMTLKNLFDSQICVEILFDIKFKQTVSILLTNKWNDAVIKELLNYSFDFLEKNYKAMK